MKDQHKGLPSPDTFANSPTFASNAPTASQYTPNKYERTLFYHGITGDTDHPALVYRSNYLTTPFPKPTAHIPIKSLRGVFNTPLNNVWDTVGPQIRDLLKARKIKWSSVDPARFFTHGPIGEEEKGSLGPVVIWNGVLPGSTSSNIAHEVSQEILALLQKNGIEDVVIEWREAVLERLSGPPLMPHVSSIDATHHVRRFLTTLLGNPLAVEDMEGTLTLWFHENKDENGNPSDKVYGVSNCHVLRKDTTTEYEYKDGELKSHVQVCGMDRFKKGIDEIKKAVVDHVVRAELWTREIVRLRDKENQDSGVKKQIRAYQRKLEDEMEAISELEALHNEVTTRWSDDRNIGHVTYAAPIGVDVEGGTLYTSDWAVFLASEEKVKDEFEGNVIDLGAFLLFV